MAKGDETLHQFPAISDREEGAALECPSPPFVLTLHFFMAKAATEGSCESWREGAPLQVPVASPRPHVLLTDWLEIGGSHDLRFDNSLE